MTPKKKVVLFILEGFNDQTALAAALDNLLTTENAVFEVTDGDITSDKSGKNVVSKIGDCVNLHCKKYGYEKSDILEVVLLTDMDGAYINQESIVQNDDYIKPYYNADKILHFKPEDFKKIHTIKQGNLNRLIYLPTVCRTIPFSIYFFSCNLDHVVCEDANLTQREKSNAAKSFERKYHSDIAGFLTFFKDENIAVGNTYDESWNYIKQDNNSLKRCSNLNVFLSPAAARTPRDFINLFEDAQRVGQV
jgi:hypothetical protein